MVSPEGTYQGLDELATFTQADLDAVKMRARKPRSVDCLVASDDVAPLDPDTLTRPPTVHELRCTRGQYDAIVKGDQRAITRRDNGYVPGEVLRLTDETGRTLDRQITHVSYYSTDPDPMSVQLAVMSLAPIDPDSLTRPLAEERLCVAVLVTDPSDRVLLVRHPTRGWELPGGKAEPGELPSVAAHREVKEETGLEIVLSTNEPEELSGGPCAGADFRSRILVFRGRTERNPDYTNRHQPRWWKAQDVLDILSRACALSPLAIREPLIRWAHEQDDREWTLEAHARQSVVTRILDRLGLVHLPERVNDITAILRSAEKQAHPLFHVRVPTAEEIDALSKAESSGSLLVVPYASRVFEPTPEEVASCAVLATVAGKTEREAVLEMAVSFAAAADKAMNWGRQLEEHESRAAAFRGALEKMLQTTTDAAKRHREMGEAGPAEREEARASGIAAALRLLPARCNVDHTTSDRPAVLGGECSDCLHRPPLHEPHCERALCTDESHLRKGAP